APRAPANVAPSFLYARVMHGDALTGPACGAGHARGGLVRPGRRLRPGQRRDLRPLPHLAGGGRLRLLDLEPGVPAGPGARGAPVAAALARRPPARTDRSRHRRRPGPDHAVDAAVLAGRVRDLPGDHLRRTGLPGLGRGAAFGRRTAWRAAFLVLAGTVAAC